MYTLYCSFGSCSRAAHVILQESGALFDIKLLDGMKGEMRTPEFLAINPRGQVPVLRDGDFVLTEGAAIIQYICDQNQAALAHLLPVAYPERARALQWLMYFNSGVHPIFGQIFQAARNYEDAALQAAVKQAAYKRLEDAYNALDAHLAQNAFCAGAAMTVADILMTVVSNWSRGAQLPFAYGPNVTRVMSAVEALPSYQAAVAREASAREAKEKVAAA